MDIEFTAEEIKRILDDLKKPFRISEVRWRVTATNKDASHGLLVPYADLRAFSQRLNDVLSPAGWSVEYKTETMAGLQRIVNGKVIQSGKIITVATLSIFGISSKSSMGEMWADDGNAVTRAEAQAFKRAAEMFGLGLYFRQIYEIAKGSQGANYWVPIDGKKVPTKIPSLPSWALLPEDRRSEAKDPGHAESNGRQRGQVQQMQTRQQSEDAEFEAKKKRHISVLGQPLFESIVAGIDRLVSQGHLKGNKFTVLENTLTAKGKLLNLVSAKAAEMPAGAMDALLDRHKVDRLDLISNYTVLDSIADEFGLRLPKAA